MWKLFLIMMTFTLIPSFCGASSLELEDAKTSFEKSDSWIDISNQIVVKKGIKEYGYQINDENVLLINVHNSVDKEFKNIVQVGDMQDFARNYAEGMEKAGNGAIKVIDFGAEELGNTEWILTNYTIVQNGEILYVRGFSTVNCGKEITFSFHHPSREAFDQNEETNLRIMKSVVTRQEPSKKDTDTAKEAVGKRLLDTIIFIMNISAKYFFYIIIFTIITVVFKYGITIVFKYRKNK